MKQFVSRTLLAALLPALILLSACKKDATDATPPVASTTAAPAVAAYQVGSKVDVNWNGSWWQGEVTEVKSPDLYRVHYTGWSNSWDEDAVATRLRAPTGTAKAGSEGATPAPADTATVAAAAVKGTKPIAAVVYKAGQKVDVNWNGSWWQGKVLAVPTAGQYRVHYLGWQASWDETVPATRLRAGTDTAQKGTGPT